MFKLAILAVLGITLVSINAGPTFTGTLERERESAFEWSGRMADEDEFVNHWQSDEEKQKWYTGVKQYWEEQQPSIEPMVEEGGLRNGPLDIEGSNAFLSDVYNDTLKTTRKGLDLGGGVGRVAKGVLLRFVKNVDLIDQSSRLVFQARLSLGSNRRTARDDPNPGGKYEVARIQDYEPTLDTYDLVCLQWVAMYLSDIDLANILLRYRKSMKAHGLYFIKDSIIPAAQADSKNKGSVLHEGKKIIRTEDAYERIFHKVGLKILKKDKQVFPPADKVESRPVAMWLLGWEDISTIERIDGGEITLFGKDSGDGQFFYSLQGLWKHELRKKDSWNQHNQEYWNKREANVNNPEIAGMDLEESEGFIGELVPTTERFKRKALDIGAGVGRVAQAVLLKYVYTVDLVDQGQHFLNEAKKRLGQRNQYGKYIHASAKDYQPPPDTYDIVCFQYTLLYLSDDDVVDVLKRSAKALKSNGFIYVKDNLPSNPDRFQVNRDSGFNIFRTIHHYQWLFRRAGLKVVKEQKQQKWLANANPVIMFALKPRNS